jgi:hypothetical protein
MKGLDSAMIAQSGDDDLGSRVVDRIENAVAHTRDLSGCDTEHLYAPLSLNMLNKQTIES